MDGLLIDSEPLWRQAEKEVFASVGVVLTDAMCEETMGQRTDEVVDHWYRIHRWCGPEPKEVAHRITSRVQLLVEDHGCALDGVVATLDTLEEAGFVLAVASSSAPPLIDAVLGRLGIKDRFAAVCSAVHEVLGKPDPAVYFTAADRLGVQPSQCLVFEDSLAGVQAARAAGMTVVAVPAPNLFDQPGFDLAQVKLPSLTAFSLDLVCPGRPGRVP